MTEPQTLEAARKLNEFNEETAVFIMKSFAINRLGSHDKGKSTAVRLVYLEFKDWSMQDV